ncbi:hypothetical protein [Mycobacteroides salmoniphilum]|uniref:PQQ enzyme repeat protein n=1 Tax=Mycobacteroides salmoniphilum TaxID=404941 RepID=A0A4R8SKQ9_9MYCO|nr:hypothetical protein [Mycobacteroides salmoniphilum]TDZ98179.1 hypothetical protein CCUG60885_00043 [Mycobacteroides salmoniphilum]TEA02708.1 hypothetical protein CCUG60883_03326 [Mycobacteroides salmoniphilum]
MWGEGFRGRVAFAVRRVARPSSWAAVCLLLPAIALATYSLRATGPTGQGPQVWAIENSLWGVQNPGNIAGWARAFAAAALVALAVGWVNRTVSKLLTRTVAVVGLFLMCTATYSLIRFYLQVSSEYPPTQQIPLAYAAWSLTIFGLIATLLAAPPADTPAPLSWRTAGTGALVGALVSVLVTGFAYYESNDGRFVDATTAAPSAPPAPLTDVDQRIFSISMGPAPTPDLPTSDPQIVSTTTGFAVLRANRVTAYGPRGQERWHYERTGPTDVLLQRIQVFDQGTTVVLDTATWGLSVAPLYIGLDADTGRLLWTSNAKELGDVLQLAELGPTLHAINGDYGGRPWTRVDTRTGQYAQTEEQLQCDGDRQDTPTLVVLIGVCEPDKATRVYTFDPVTGARGWTSPPVRYNRGSDVVESTGPNSFLVSSHEKPTTGPYGIPETTGVTLVDIAHQRVVPLSKPGESNSSADGNGWFALTSTRYLYNPSGQPQCRLPEIAFAMGQLPFGSHLFAAAGNRVLMINFMDPLNLHIIETAHCTVEHRVSTSAFVNKMLMAPGVLLVLQESDGELHLDGYARSPGLN